MRATKSAPWAPGAAIRRTRLDRGPCRGSPFLTNFATSSRHVGNRPSTPRATSVANAGANETQVAFRSFSAVLLRNSSLRHQAVARVAPAASLCFRNGRDCGWSARQPLAGRMGARSPRVRDSRRWSMLCAIGLRGPHGGAPAPAKHLVATKTPPKRGVSGSWLCELADVVGASRRFVTRLVRAASLSFLNMYECASPIQKPRRAERCLLYRKPL
jgi:hypothetical protein